MYVDNDGSYKAFVTVPGFHESEIDKYFNDVNAYLYRFEENGGVAFIIKMQFYMIYEEDNELASSEMLGDLLQAKLVGSKNPPEDEIEVKIAFLR